MRRQMREPKRESLQVPVKISTKKLLAGSRCAALLAIALLSPAFAPAQNPPPAPVPKRNSTPPPNTAPAPQPQAVPQSQGQTESQAKIVSNVNLVVLPVTVKDSSGRLVPDLRRDEFKVLDDNVEQRIDTFSAEPFPLSIVVLLDNDLKKKDADQVQTSLRAIIGGMSLADEASVCRFDTYFHPDQGFTKDQDKLMTELRRTRINESPSQQPSTIAAGPPYASTPTINGQAVGGGGAPAVSGSTVVIGQHSTKAIDDAVFGAAELLKDRGRERHKVIFLISDGVNSKENTNEYKNVVSELLRYNITVYSIGVGNATYNRMFSRLKAYATDTGGDTYYGGGSQALSELYARVAEEARNVYMLAYVPHGNDRTKEYHSVEVRVLRPNLDVKTRQGYYSGVVPR